MKIVIIGAGAFGSHLLQFTRNLKATFRVVDFDKVEMKNTKSQVHTQMGLRRNKAQAIQQMFQGLWGVRLDAVPHKLTTDNAEAILGKAELVLDCTDNAEARQVIQGYVREQGIPCLHCGLSADGAFARIVWDEHFVIDAEDVVGAATCEDGEFLPFFALAAAQAATVVQAFVEKGTRRSYQLSPAGTQRLA